MPLTKRESRIATKYARLLKVETKAKMEWDHLEQLTNKLAEELRGKPVRIAEDGRFLIAENRAEKLAQGITQWGHGAVRKWNLITKKLD